MKFTYSAERLAALSSSVSAERLAPYQQEGDGSPEETFRLYEANCHLSASFYIPLQALEVAVRNDMDRALSERFGEDWIEGKDIILEPRQSADIYHAIGEVSKDERGRSKDYSRGAIIAELNFGFWVGLLGPKNEVELWRKGLYKAFPHRPKGSERRAVQGALNSIRRLRNRIAHHCRIIHRNLEDDHDLILEVIGWVCPETRDWAASLSTFDEESIPSTGDNLPILNAEGAEPAEAKPTRDGRQRLSLNKKS